VGRRRRRLGLRLSGYGSEQHRAEHTPGQNGSGHRCLAETDVDGNPEMVRAPTVGVKALLGLTTRVYRRFLALAPALLAWDLGPARPRRAQADRDRLLAARDLLARAARSQRAALALAHSALDLLLRRLPVLRHVVPPAGGRGPHYGWMASARPMPPPARRP